jgi:hypothetical protein
MDAFRAPARRSCARLASAALAGLTVAISALAAEQIPWATGPASLAPSTPDQIASTLTAVRSRDADGTARVVVQFHGPVEDHVRAALAKSGVELQQYVGGYAFFAKLDSRRLNPAAVSAVSEISGVAEVQTAWKVDAFIQNDEVPSWAHVDTLPSGERIVGAYVVFHRDVDLFGAGVNVAQSFGADVRDFIRSINGLVIELPESALKPLAGASEVEYLQTAMPQMSHTNAENRTLHQVNTVQAAPYSLTGAGVTVLVYDAGTARATHNDFQGRLSVKDGSGQIAHATHVSGTIGGAGVANAAYKGMAPGVTIVSYGFQYSGGGTFLYDNPGDLDADYAQAINTYGADISNNSIGTNTESNGFNCAIQGDYGVTSASIDAIVAGAFGAPFRIVWANGNERQGNRCDIEGYGDYYSTAPPAGAKNHIAVGAINSNDQSMTSFSSWGPTDDGRMRPDISAGGCQSNGDSGVTSCTSTSDTAYTAMCGTSMASPTVCGMSALILQDFRNQFAGAPDIRNSTLKALLAHTAADLGNVGPDHQFGYGSVRVKDAIDFLRTGRFDEDVVSQSGSYTRTFTVAPGTASIKWTLAWDDAPAAPGAHTNALVNDLDLRVYGPGGTQHFPWTLNPTNPGAAAVRTARNSRDNLEQVLIDNPPAGQYTIEVFGFNVPSGAQSFSLLGDGVSYQIASIRILTELPPIVAPGTALTIDAQTATFGDSIVAGSPTLHLTRDGVNFQGYPMALVGPNLYRVTLPALNCDELPGIYATATAAIGGPVADPQNAPATFYGTTVGALEVLAEDSFETDTGWTTQASAGVTEGQWQRAIPVNCNRGDPPADYDTTGAGYCFLTDNAGPSGDACNSDIDGGTVWLISPTYDLSAGGWQLSFALWYTNNYGAAPNSDTMKIEVSNDNGANWITMETIGPTSSSGWTYKTYNVTTFVPPTSQVKFRFEASDLGSGSVVEAAIDALKLHRVGCEQAPIGCSGDLDCDGDVDFFDIDPLVLAFQGEAAYLAAYPNCLWLNGDCDGDNDVDFFDIDWFVGLLGSNCP